MKRREVRGTVAPRPAVPAPKHFNAVVAGAGVFGASIAILLALPTLSLRYGRFERIADVQG